MSIETPAGWAGDPLSAFLDLAFRNSLAFFEARAGEYAKLRDVDAAFQTLVESRPVGFAAFFLVRCHGAFRGAVRIASSGQVPETYALLRSALEWALYASYVEGNEELATTWLRRHDGEAADGSATPESEESRKRVKRAFTVANVMTSLNGRSPEIHDRTSDLYEHAIDSGAHPNERALTSDLRPEEAGTFELSQIAREDSSALRLAVKRTSQVGVCCLDIFELLWTERFRILNLDATMNSVRSGL